MDSFGQCDPRNYSVHMIPTPLIYEIKSKIKKDITSSPDKDIIYSKGDRVVILGGNYMGRQGIVNKITENRQVSLNLERKPGKILAVETIEEAIQKGKQEKSMNPTEVKHKILY